MRVQLLSFPGCPNVASARVAIDEATRRVGLAAATIEEVDITAPETPERLRGWASPTILIDGADLEGHRGPDGGGCRLYAEGQGAPNVETIERRLRETTAGRVSRPRKGTR